MKGTPMLRRVRTGSVGLLLLGLSGCHNQKPADQEKTFKPMTLERFYSLPHVIGTEPRGVSWAGDSSKLAFLWNDDGGNFRDVWVASPEKPEPSRVTAMPRPAPLPDPGGDLDALRSNDRVERHPGVTSLSWHPDGERLLFSFEGDLFWSRPGGSPTQLTDTPERESSASFSPDGRYLAFLKGGDLRLSVVREDGIGSAENLTRIRQPGIAVETFRWSPDSRAIAFVRRDSRPVPTRQVPDYLTEETSSRTVSRALPGEPSALRRLGVKPLRGPTRWMEIGDDRSDLIFSYHWSPDSKRLLVDKSDLNIKDRRIFSLNAASGSARLRYREKDPRNVMAFWSAAWRADGKAIYFTSDRDGYYHLYRLEEGSSSPTPMTQGEWEVAGFHVGPDDVFLVANKQRPEERHIYRLDSKGGPLERVSEMAGTHVPVYSPDARAVATLFSSDLEPPDLFLITRQPDSESSSQPARVTRSPLDEFDEFNWVAAKYVTFNSHVDGVELHGRLIVPPDFDPGRKYPAILGSVYSNTLRNQWGGRNAHPLWGLDQYLAQEGYVILTVDFRGSWGHGREFRRRMRFDYGGIDTEDIYSGVLYLKETGYVDMERIGIWGSSYGGLLTCMSLFKKPGVYKAGVAGAPATNVWHATTGEMRVMGRPQDQPEAYLSSSAFHYAHGLEDQLMIIHGMRDRIVLFKDSVVLFQNLMLLGKADKVEFVPLPDSGHGWDREGLYQTRFAFKKLVQHFDRHLGATDR